MNILKSFFAVAIAISVSTAQPVNISGKVTDTGGISIAGASVWLEKGGQTATSNADGSFTLTGMAGIHGQINRLQPRTLSATIKSGLLLINGAEGSTVEVITYTLQGKVIAVVQKTAGAGSGSIVLPHQGAGVYLYKVKSGRGEVLIKGYSVNRVSGGNTVVVREAFSKRAEAAASINDVIAVTKEGYLNYRVMVTSPDTSGIEIKMLVCEDTVIDADGNKYQAVRIGNQVWTVENLRATKYNDGMPISTWSGDTTGKYCYYKYTTNQDSCRKFGAIYDWYAVNTGKLASTGWHVPTDTEWETLQEYLVSNGYNWDGTTTGNKIAKSLATKADWWTFSSAGSIGDNVPENNRSYFSAFPAGFRTDNGDFLNAGNVAGWWSATQSDGSNAYYRYLGFNKDSLCRLIGDKMRGFSVRLVRDGDLSLDRNGVTMEIGDSWLFKRSFLTSGLSESLGIPDTLCGYSYFQAIKDTSINSKNYLIIEGRDYEVDKDSIIQYTKRSAIHFSDSAISMYDFKTGFGGFMSGVLKTAAPALRLTKKNFGTSQLKNLGMQKMAEAGGYDTSIFSDFVYPVTFPLIKDSIYTYRGSSDPNGNLPYRRKFLGIQAITVPSGAHKAYTIEWLVKESLGIDSVYAYDWVGKNGLLKRNFDYGNNTIEDSLGAIIDSFHCVENLEHIGNADIDPDTLIPWGMR